MFEDDGHTIYMLDRADIVALVPSPTSRAGGGAAGTNDAGGDVHRFLSDPSRGLPADVAQETAEPYRGTLMLDEIGQPTIQGTVIEGGGTYVQGGVSAFFSDMLGDRALGVGVQVGGTLADLGAELLYVSRRHRWNWVTSIGVSPYVIGYISRIDTADAITVREVTQRQICKCATGAATLSVQLLDAARGRGLRADAVVRERRPHVGVRSGDARAAERDVRADRARGTAVSRRRQHRARPDTTYFGATAPIMGIRSRFEIGFSKGSLRYQTLLLDWRRYYMPLGPVTIAVRGLHFGRYGVDSDNPRLIELYVGYPEFVHGYGVGSFSAAECPSVGGRAECAVFDKLIGSRMVVANVEVRAPLRSLFTGQLEYGRLPIDVAAFFDMGVAWTRTSVPTSPAGRATSSAASALPCASTSSV